jgi:hypothetical protein
MPDCCTFYLRCQTLHCSHPTKSRVAAATVQTLQRHGDPKMRISLPPESLALSHEPDLGLLDRVDEAQQHHQVQSVRCRCKLMAVIAWNRPGLHARSGAQDMFVEAVAMCADVKAGQVVFCMVGWQVQDPGVGACFAASHGFRAMHNLPCQPCEPLFRVHMMIKPAASSAAAMRS